MRGANFICTVGLMMALVAFGCDKDDYGNLTPKTTILPSSDSTSPSISLLIFGIPSPAEDPEGVNDSCCPKLFDVPVNKRVDLIATGEDLDGGVRHTVIFFEVTRFCDDPSTDLRQSRKKFGILGDSRDTSSPPSTPGSVVRTHRLVQGSFRISDHAPSCLPEAPQTVSFHGEIWASAFNYSDLESETKRVSLIANV
jgi:hypothetical protein